MVGLAKVLRKSQTDAEKIVWQKLRSKQLNGWKFKRQQPLGRYIVDFVCFDKKLIIEIDGGHHATQRDADRQRELWLQSEGFEVVRFWNNDIFENIDGVLETIMKKLSTPSP
jgi:very-short-patch-repair endonuclease